MFWQNFILLCNKKGISPNGLCAELGFSTATATKWKKGSVPHMSTLAQIAKYFNVSVEYLMGETEERAPEQSDQPTLSEGEKKLLELFRRVPLESQDAVLQMIEAALRIK